MLSKGRSEPVLSHKPVDRENGMRIFLLSVHMKPDQADGSKIVEEDGLVKIIPDGFVKSPSSRRANPVE